MMNVKEVTGPLSNHFGDKNFILQREIELKKRAREKFGVTLTSILRRCIVTYIFEAESELAAVSYLYPAARAGLEFGDEIVTVNGIQV